MSNKDYEIILFHSHALKDKDQKNYITKSTSIKVCAFTEKDPLNSYDAYLELPTTIKDLNTIIENAAVKKEFNKNSAIRNKDYLLNKNEKKLFKL